MPRKPRLFLPGVAVHIVQRGHSRNPVFLDNNDYQTYLDFIYHASRRHQCEVHAYVLMTNHIHLLVTPAKDKSVSKFMHAVNSHYVPYFNFTYGTSGSIWEGRFKASLINNEQYLLTCMRYIELNPVRARMVKTPRDYRWSSYKSNAIGNYNPLLTHHNLYRSLGIDTKSRLAAYRSLFDTYIDDGVLMDIRNCCQTGTPLGNKSFKEKVRQELKHKIGYERRGRPSKRV
jgi:putative transposase